MTCRQFVCGFLLILACGGKDGLDSGLPADKQGSELAADEQDSLCGAANEYVGDHVSNSDFAGYLCTLDGFSEAADAGGDTAAKIATCKQARQDCIANPDPEDEVKLGLACNDEIEWSMCAASVAEIEACLQDSIDQLDGLITDFTCDVLDPARAMALQEKYGDAVQDPFPPSCDPVLAKCPSLLTSDDSDEDDEEF